MNKQANSLDQQRIKEEAAEWLIKLDGDDKLSADQELALKEWMSRSAYHQQAIQQLNSLWQRTELTELIYALNTPSSTWAGLKSLFGLNVLGSLMPNRVVLAAVTLVLSISLFFTMPTDNTELVQYFEAEPGAVKEVLFADQSNIVLGVEAEIETRFDDEYRDVYLTKGRANFKVAKDKDKPFRVFVGESVVQAIGTEFTIEHIDGQVKVLVNEGKIAIANNQQNFKLSEQNKLLEMTQNRYVEMSYTDQQLKVGDIVVVSDAESHKRNAWQSGQLLFEGDPLAFVVDEVKKLSGRNVVLQDPSIATKEIGGVFYVNEMDNFFVAIKENFNINVEYMRDGTIVLAAR